MKLQIAGMFIGALIFTGALYLGLVLLLSLSQYVPTLP